MYWERDTEAITDTFCPQTLPRPAGFYVLRGRHVLYANVYLPWNCSFQHRKVPHLVACNAPRARIPPCLLPGQRKPVCFPVFPPLAQCVCPLTPSTEPGFDVCLEPPVPSF